MCTKLYYPSLDCSRVIVRKDIHTYRQTDRQTDIELIAIPLRELVRTNVKRNVKDNQYLTNLILSFNYNAHQC